MWLLILQWVFSDDFSGIAEWKRIMWNIGDNGVLNYSLIIIIIIIIIIINNEKCPEDAWQTTILLIVYDVIKLIFIIKIYIYDTIYFQLK